MITARWFDAAKTMVEVSDGNTVKLFPASLRSPDWPVLLRLVDAGEVTIADYEPPQPQAQGVSQ